VNLRVRRSYSSSSRPADGALQIRFTPIKPASAADEECVDTPAYTFTTASWPAAWGAAPNGVTLGYASQSATTFDPGLPFGTYSICLIDPRGSQSDRFRPYGVYDNTQVNGGALQELNPTSGWDDVPC
jgi:hypothetical protein